MQEMRMHITEVIATDFDNPNTHWEWIKFKVREFCISYTVGHRREQKKLMDALGDKGIGDRG